jgi:Fur family peroxide stress response transcriptional regulator
MKARTKDRTAGRLRKKSLRATPQRIAILEYLESAKIHPSAEEIHKAISKHVDGVSLATVYNTVERLVGSQEADKIFIADDRARYEARRSPHHHFYCKHCGAIFDIDIACPHLKTMQAGQHKIEEVHGYFKGTCAKCLKK